MTSETALTICYNLTTEQMLEKARAFGTLYDCTPEIWVFGTYMERQGYVVSLADHSAQVLLPRQPTIRCWFRIRSNRGNQEYLVKPVSGNWEQVRYIKPARKEQETQ